MTLASYILSKILSKNLSEPYWLSQIIFNKKEYLIAGWLLHILSGAGFLLLLQVLQSLITTGFLLQSLIIGVIEGIIGICIWSTLFYIKYKPKEINEKLYYINLLIAHIVFAFTAVYLLKIKLPL